MYITQSRKAAIRRQRLTVTLSLFVAVIAFGLAGLALYQWRIAEENFKVAKTAADGLVFDIARGLRDVEGIRISSVRKILKRSSETFDKLLLSSPDNLELLKSRLSMMNEFFETYLAVGDTDEMRKAARESLELSKKIASKDNSFASQSALSLSLLKTGDALNEVGDFDEARKFYSDSLTLRRKLASLKVDELRFQRDVSVALNRLGEIEELVGNFADSKFFFQEGLEIRQNLVKQNA